MQTTLSLLDLTGLFDRLPSPLVTFPGVWGPDCVKSMKKLVFHDIIKVIKIGA